MSLEEPPTFQLRLGQSLVADASRASLEIDIEARRNSRAICSGCHCKGPGYDRLLPRQFEFVPLW